MSNPVSHDIGLRMEKYREYIGWGAIIVAALSFLRLPFLSALPPMLSAPMLMMLPGVGPVLIMLVPMLLFAAGIGLVKGWDGGRKLFVVWAVIGGLAAVAGLQYIPAAAAVDLAVIGVSLLVVLWGDWRRLLPGR
ncbi:MAG: hypothetical protein GW808_09210 [Sphingomonadales bacterium]|nr:hypothetical protein [Sphingomonadales bacterium]PIX66248.1 MAG: hypothetical protein COZ43_07605 [Sphingomonadales bacterium CG_4_10_14_3_um_filter_58_15]NCO49433.1 hypothetical protein [Sphingomonadales bacterium]NCP00788.1 hypothetical protein [Sphingomonadales bacterium]NCP26352.1 hypothetical protein [Sphingomonadales bacterium]